MSIPGDLAVRLILGAVLVLSASQAGAEVIGHERGILGGEEGFFRPRNGVVAGSSVVIAALPYARTVTCGSYTLTGTAPGAGAVTWSASPSGSSGSCTGTTSWSCVVDVDPDASGEGVEVITVAQSGASSAQATLGFYVEGEHSCFLSQSVDGTYNSTRVNLDPVATWENLGLSALDVTQATGSAQPTFRTSIVGGQPIVRCDGGDTLAAATAADWTFLSNGTDWTVEHVAATTSANPNVLQVVVATADPSTASNRGTFLGLDDRSSSSRNDRVAAFMSSGGAFILNASSADNVALQQRFNLGQWILDDGSATEFVGLVNGNSGISVVTVTAYNTGAPQLALNMCTSSTTFPLTGDLFRVLIYQSALSATQREINKAVDEWALGGSLPVTP